MTADMTPGSWSNALTVMETLLVQICVKWTFAGANGLEMVWNFCFANVAFRFLSLRKRPLFLAICYNIIDGSSQPILSFWGELTLLTHFTEYPIWVLRFSLRQKYYYEKRRLHYAKRF